MTKSKVLVEDYASLLESKLLPDTDRTYLLSEADIVINPYCSALMNKTLIINLPIEVPIDRLMPFNTLVSRFPIGYGIPVVPYNMPEDRESIELDDYSCLILTKYAFTEMELSKKIKGKKFLIGTSEVLDGEASLVGYVISETMIEDL